MTTTLAARLRRSTEWHTFVSVVPLESREKRERKTSQKTHKFKLTRLG